MKPETIIREKKKAEDSKNESASALLAKLKHEKERLIKEKLILNSKGISFKDTDDAPFEIPKNWIWVMLNEVSIIQEGPGIRKHQYKKEGIQFLTVTNILEGSVDLEKSKKYVALKEFNDKYKHYKINKNDIVTACSGASWGKSAIYDHDNTLMLNTSTLRLRFFGDYGNNPYLYYLTKADFFKKQIEEQLSGQQPNFGYAHYSKIKIPLPPLIEQDRIVAIIESALKSVEKTKCNFKKNINNSKELFENYLQSVLDNIGKDCEIKKVFEIGKVYNGNSINEKVKKDKYFNLKNGVPFIGTKDISFKGEINYDNGVKIPLKEKLLFKIAPKNTVLICAEGGSAGRKIGFTNQDVCFGNKLFALSTFKEIDSRYVYYLYLSSSFQKYFKAELSGIIGGVSMNKFKEIEIPIPSLKDQLQIVEKLDSLSSETKKTEAIYEQKLIDLEELKKSILQKAFAGELK